MRPGSFFASRSTFLALAVPVAMLGCGSQPASRAAASESSAPPPALGPGAYRLAFNSTRDGNYEVYTTTLDGSVVVNLTSNPATEWVCAADDSLYLVSNRGGARGGYDLFVMAPDGTGLRQVSRFLVYDSYLGIGPGGGRLVISSRKDGDTELYIIDRDGQELAKLTDNSDSDNDPAWSPDGRWIVFRSKRGGTWNLWIMAADGSAARQLTDFAGNDVGDQGYGGEMPPRWSPDGGRILFSAWRDGNFDICTIRPDGTGLTNLTATPGDEGWPSWSPDGQWIAFDAKDAADEKNYDLWIMRADGSGRRQVTSHPKSDLSPVWVR